MKAILNSVLVLSCFLLYQSGILAAPQPKPFVIAQNEEPPASENNASASVPEQNSETKGESDEPESETASGAESAEVGPSDTGTAEDSEEEEDPFGDLENEFQAAEAEGVYDPLEGYNRVMTDFNDGFYVYVFDPVRDGYRFVVPEGGRLAVANFFDNLLFPLRFVNNALQAKLKNTGEETLRFMINSTLGILGFFDPAEAWFGLEAHSEDFGQTLGYWGVGSGPHIVLPFLGPSNLRDTFTLLPDDQLDALATSGWMADQVPGDLSLPASIGLKAFRKLNDYSVAKFGYQDIKKDALDLYPYLRDAYEALRKKQISE